MGKTFFDKIWDMHVVADLSDGFALLQIDRHLMHDGGAQALLAIKEQGLGVHNPELTFATADHVITTTPGRADMSKNAAATLRHLRAETKARGIRYFDIGSGGQGIIHVVGPEQGLSLPGALIVCGDSHTCTHGGMGAVAFGIGSPEVVHGRATQCLVQQRPQPMRVTFRGTAKPGIAAKDMILHLIGRIGTAGGVGYAVEYAGEAVRALEIEARLTLCNLSIELGAKMGFVAPDEKTFAYLKGKPLA